MRATVVVLLLSALTAGCGGRRERSVAGNSGKDAAAPAPPDAGIDAEPERGGPDDPLAEKLRHCPITVDGARTAIEDVDGGIAIVVTADADSAVTEIRKRAAHLVAFTTDQAARKAHGGGDGGGFMRNCPVVTRDTRIATDDVAAGSRLVVQPTSPLTVPELRAETRRRYDALVSP